MTTFNLHFKTVTEIDFGGFTFYVEAGGEFDADDYAESFSIMRSEMDSQDVHSAQNAAAQLNAGQWLAVSHGERNDN